MQYSFPPNLRNPCLVFCTGFVSSLTLFLFTLARGVVWGDSAKLTLYALKGEPMWGSIAGHPLHTLAGMVALQLWPFDNPAWVINAVSALMAALSVGLAGLIALQLSNRQEGAWITMATLSFSHTFWSLAVVAESYTMAIAFGGTVTLLLLHSRSNRAVWLPMLAGCLSGLSVGINALTMLALPGFLHLQVFRTYTIHWRSSIRRLFLYFIGVAFGLITLKFLAFAISGAQVNQSTAFSDVSSQAGEYLRGFDLRKLLMSAPNLIYQFPWLLLLPAWVFVVCRQRRHWRWAEFPYFLPSLSWPQWSLLVAAASVVLFASTYQYQRHFVFLSYPFFFLSILLGVWLATSLSRISSLIVRALTLLIIPLINVPVYAWLHRLPGVSQAISYRDLPGRGATYFFQPWKHTLNPSPEAWGNPWIYGLPEKAVVLADFTPARVLSYCRIREQRSDVTILETDRFLTVARGSNSEGFIRMLDKQLDTGRPVFLGDRHPQYYFISDLKQRYHLEPYANGFRVISKASVAP
jgi:hypothetical protein